MPLKIQSKCTANSISAGMSAMIVMLLNENNRISNELLLAVRALAKVDQNLLEGQFLKASLN